MFRPAFKVNKDIIEEDKYELTQVSSEQISHKPLESSLVHL